MYIFTPYIKRVRCCLLKKKNFHPLGSNIFLIENAWSSLCLVLFLQYSTRKHHIEAYGMKNLLYLLPERFPRIISHDAGNSNYAKSNFLLF